MSAVSRFVLRVKRAETPFYARLKRIARKITRSRIPVPLPWIWAMEAIHTAHGIFALVWMRARVMLYTDPLFRRRCLSVGENLHLERLPHIGGHTRITIGDDVMISGALSIGSSRICDAPELIVGNRVFLGHGVVIHASKKVVIEDDVLVAAGSFITDSNEHPIDMERRIRGEACTEEEIRPVYIRRGAWIGKNCIVLRGVEVGEGAILGAGSTLSRDLPPFTIAAGNPAVIVRAIPAAEPRPSASRPEAGA